MNSSGNGDSNGFLPMKEEYSNASLFIKVETVIKEEKCDDVQDSQGMSHCLSATSTEKILVTDAPPTCKKEDVWANIRTAFSKSVMQPEDIIKSNDVSPVKCDVEALFTEKIIVQSTGAPSADAKHQSSTESEMVFNPLTTSPESKVSIVKQEEEEHINYSSIVSCSTAYPTHVKGCTHESNACSSCHKGPHGIEELQHRTKMCTGKQKHECQVCHKTFTRSTSLRRHIKLHARDSPHKCTVCNKVFARAQNLKFHMTVHTKKGPYVCHICNKTFSQNGKIQKHMTNHSGDKPYVCNLCDKAFTQVENLKAHMKTHTGERPFVCHICNKTFALRGNLTQHINRHLNKKPHVCDICDKAFKLVGDLKRHKRSHTGERPYVCNVCNKGLVDAQSLRRHMRIHTR